MEKGTRLVINLRDGIVEVEGESSFVQSVYSDFKERIGNSTVFLPPSQKQHLEQVSVVTEHDGQHETSASRRAATKTRQGRKKAEGGAGKSNSYKPNFRSDLDSTNLSKFYDRFAPTNHREKILVFAAFLRDELKISPCSVDDIFTCYFTLKDRTETPEAFIQALRDAHNKTHYIDFDSVQEIRITIPGNNHLSTMEKRKGRQD